MAAVNLTLGLGAKTVLDHVDLNLPARAVTSVRADRLRQGTFLRTLNRMNDKASDTATAAMCC